ncbi:MAG: hypothetical protein JO199_11825 [Candidatus Eremiobacteraeota bacterium]|nr:hypothetical protein [Candidatus Eremiobacteraeota bacterium]
MSGIPDPFPTTKLSVPNLSELVNRLRDPTIRHCVTVVHAKREGEGEWVLGNAAARLMRSKMKTFGPSPGTVEDLVDHALRIEAKIVFLGELRRDDDGMALRKAASFGCRPVGIITCIRLGEAKLVLEAMGPWGGYNVALLSTDEEAPKPK